MMKISYSKGWFRAKKRPIEPWPEERARTAHEQRLPYVAVIGMNEKPSAFVEFNDDYVGVGF